MTRVVLVPIKLKKNLKHFRQLFFQEVDIEKKILGSDEAENAAKT